MLIVIVLVLGLVALALEWRGSRLKAQVKSLRSSRNLHATALSYAPENAARGVHITRMDTARSLVWVAYDHAAGEIYAVQALQKLLEGDWSRVPSLSTAGQDVYRYRAPAPRPGDERR